MASPSGTSFQRPDIGESLTEFDVAANEAGFVGLELAPPFMTPEQAGNFERIPLEALLEETDTARNSKGGYQQSDFEFEQDSYATKEHGVVERVDDRQAKIYAYALDYDVICANRARWKVLVALEREIKAAFEAMGAATAIPIPWDQLDTCDPVGDVLNEIDTFKTGCGMLPNAGWLTDKLLRKLARCARIKDQIKYSGMDDPKLLTEPTKRNAFLRALADMMGLEKLVVAASVRNTANKGQTFSTSNIWTDSVFGLVRVPTSRDLSEPGAARLFCWDGDGAGVGGTFEQYYSDEYRSNMIRFRHERQLKTVHSVCCRRLTGALSA
jgi:hypothetical protein